MQYERLIKLIGEKTFDILKNKTVLIIGIGGVGSYAYEAIIRSGINNIIIVDYDNVDITNLNRQIIALNNNIGLKKTQVAKERGLTINKDANIITYDILVDESNINNLFNQKIDYVIDACDDIKAKQLIIKKCLKEKIPFISSMGTANKFKPELLTITDLRKTSYDKLAKKLRKWVIYNNIKGKIPVVSSIEETKRIKGLGSTSFVPATAGLLCASYIINTIIKEGRL